MPAFKLGNRWRFKRSRLDEWMDRQSEIQAAEFNPEIRSPSSPRCNRRLSIAFKGGISREDRFGDNSAFCHLASSQAIPPLEFHDFVRSPFPSIAGRAGLPLRMLITTEIQTFSWPMQMQAASAFYWVTERESFPAGPDRRFLQDTFQTILPSRT